MTTTSSRNGPETSPCPSLQSSPNEKDSAWRYQGTHGIQPDVLERLDLCRAEGRRWFREVIFAGGRRGSKGHLGGYAGAYVLWNYMAKGDPQAHYGLDRDKRLACFVFAGKKDHARANQWQDLANFILGAPCFTDWGPAHRNFISRSRGDSLTVFAPHDWLRREERQRQGLSPDDTDMASFEIVPKEATLIAGRGPASFMQFYDEMAHAVASGANRSAEEVYESATPALDQFGRDGFIYEGSSPWQMTGQFYQNWLAALEVECSEERREARTEQRPVRPVRPEMLAVQLTSWDLYEDWDRADKIHRDPHRSHFFLPLKGPIQAYDDQMRRLERANPQTFAVERRAQWAAALNAYLSPERIRAMFAPFQLGGETRSLAMQDRGLLSVTYRAHGDPSQSNANFGFAIAHAEGPDDRGLSHVVFDLITHWSPGDFVDNALQIDYLAVEDELEGYVERFMPSEVTFDPWNSVGIIQRLQHDVGQRRLPKRILVHQTHPTAALNWKVAETFKTALNLDLIHAPYYELAELELTYLQDTGGKVDHPTTGPVQTKDVFDAMANVVYGFIGDQIASYTGRALSDVTLTGALPGGLPPSGPTSREEAVHQRLRNFSRAQRVQRATASPARRTMREPYGRHQWRPPFHRS